LTRWAHRERINELSTSLCDSFLKQPDDNCLRLLYDLKKRHHRISRVNSGNSLELATTLQDPISGETVDTVILNDSGATGRYIDRTFAVAQSYKLDPLAHPVPVLNADGSTNSDGPIRETTTLRMKIGDHYESCTFAVTNTGS
ncbi:hypothetical protein FA15DRAFT_562296, partial [Coprinopsis marcescibilis]